MKKIFVLIFLFTSVTLFGQRFSGGITVGLNASQVDGDTYFGYNKFGVAAGAFVYTSISDRVDLQLDIKYMGKGARENAKDNQGFIAYQLDYIEIPVTIHFKATDKFKLYGGLGIGYLFNTSIKDEYGKRQNSYDYNETDFSSIIGLNYAIFDLLSVYMQFSYSLSPILTANPDQTYIMQRNLYNNCLSVGLNYKIQKRR